MFPLLSIFITCLLVHKNAEYQLIGGIRKPYCFNGYTELTLFYKGQLIQDVGYILEASPLHGTCLSNEDCGTIDTYCKNQTCVCRENFSVWYDSCVQLSTPPIQCSKKQKCHELLGPRSMCTKKGQCACKPFHHLHQGQCVKNRDLHDQCEYDHQCYCGAECQSKIACIHKNCTCKPGHKPYRIRRCMDDPTYIDVPDAFNFTATVHKHKSVDQAEQNNVLHLASTSESTALLAQFVFTYSLLIISYIR